MIPLISLVPTIHYSNIIDYIPYEVLHIPGTVFMTGNLYFLLSSLFHTPPHCLYDVQTHVERKEKRLLLLTLSKWIQIAEKSLILDLWHFKRLSGIFKKSVFACSLYTCVPWCIYILHLIIYINILSIQTRICRFKKHAYS